MFVVNSLQGRRKKGTESPERGLTKAIQRRSTYKTCNCYSNCPSNCFHKMYMTKLQGYTAKSAFVDLEVPYINMNFGTEIQLAFASQ